MFWGGGEIFGKRPHIFGEKKKGTFVTGSGRVHKTYFEVCAKFQGLTLKNVVDIWTFVRLSAKITP